MEFINKSSLIKFTNGTVPNEAIYNMYHSLVRQNNLTQKFKQCNYSLLQSSGVSIFNFENI